jgi:putative transposase
VARVASLAGTKVRIGYKLRPGSYAGKPSRVVDNTLARQFDVAATGKGRLTVDGYTRSDKRNYPFISPILFILVSYISP